MAHTDTLIAIAVQDIIGDAPPPGETTPKWDKALNLVNDIMTFEIPFLDSPGIRGSYRGAWDIVMPAPEKAILTSTINNAK